MDPLSASAVVRDNQNRQALLEWLYSLDGRQEPSHPRHGVYTALYGDTLHALGRAALAALGEQWHQVSPPQPGETVLLLLKLSRQGVAEGQPLQLALDLSGEQC